MRKFLNLLLVVFMISFIGIINISAINITGPDTAKAGGNIALSFSDAAISTAPDYLYDFSYDNADKVEARTAFSGFTGFSQLAFSTSTGNATYKLKNSNVDYTITFTIKDKNSGETKTKQVKVSANQEQPKPTEPTTTTTTKQETPKSNNTNLKTLEVKASDGSKVELTPTFKSDVYEYSANVSGTVKTISINATLEDSKATFVVSNNANDELVAGENNKITITVTAEDGTKRTYTLNITREALTADATLKELIIDEVEDFELIEDKYNYTIKVAKNVKELSLSYVTGDDNATVEIEGNEDLKDGSKVRITVIAQDGTKRVYTLTISKEENVTKANTANISTEKNPLIIMALSIIAFGLIGGIVYVVKK